MTYLVSTTQRCGSTWLAKVLEGSLGAKHARYVDGRMIGFKLGALSEATAVPKLAKFIVNESSFQVFKTHDIGSRDFDAICESIDLKVVTIRRSFKDVLISRYFYYRYYWPTEPSLGPLGPPLAEFFSDVSALSDEDAISCIINSSILPMWMAEWKAFEEPFANPNTLRLCYDEMVAGRAFSDLEQFLGRRLVPLDSFAHLQQAETKISGRDGCSRFYRVGGSQQWRQWMTSEDANSIDRLLG
jgi:hypothetical protein